MRDTGLNAGSQRRIPFSCNAKSAGFVTFMHKRDVCQSDMIPRLDLGYEPEVCHGCSGIEELLKRHSGGYLCLMSQLLLKAMEE